MFRIPEGVRAAGWLIVRAGAAVGLLLVATLYVLASIPFSYYHFLQFPHFWWMPGAIRWHPLVFLAAVGALAATLRAESGPMRAFRRGLLAAGAAIAACMAATLEWPVLATYDVAAALAFMPLAVMAGSGGMERLSRPHRPAGAGASWRHAVATSALAGLLVAASSLIDLAVRRGAASAGLRPPEIAAGVAASLAGHLLVFTAAALPILVLRAAAARQKWRPAARTAATLAGAAIILAVVVKRVLLAALMLGELRAAALAVAAAVAVVLYAAALVDRGAQGPEPTEPPGRPWRDVWFAAASAACVAACIELPPRLLARADWGTTLQQLAVCGAWAASVAFVVRLRRSRLRPLAAPLVGALLAVGLAAQYLSAREPERAAGPAAPFDVDLAVERYATVDLSLQVVLNLVRPFVADVQYFDELERLADATDRPDLPDVPLRFVDRMPRPAVAPPHLFIIVVDSLRPDYLSAYNPDVAFTPAIGRFARDSIVMRRAFAPYSGTALSEPSLWAGGLIPRRMYPKPFSRLNNLERLLTAAGYRRYVSLDEILQTTLDDQADIVRLDGHLAHPERREQMFKFDLCGTLDELATRLRSSAGAEPIFFYAQPQNLHIRVLAGEQYPQSDVVRVGGSTFYRPAVDALARLDACFGRFLDELKARSLYDDSVIVLTSDHGDYDGEEGRWGHAFYLSAQTLRIPLVIHVPAALREGRTWDPDAVALLTDVTPTLYELLGYGPLASSDLLGRPLMVRKGVKAPAVPAAYLVQSSYSRIFGLLDGRGAWLYVASANHAREEFFELREGSARARAMGAAERLQYRKWLLQKVAAVDAYYRPGSGTADAADW